MKENTNNQSAAASKTEGVVMENHNLIILDRSGSMMSIRKYAVDAVNETIATIRARQEANATDEKSYITLLMFCGCGLQTIYDHVPKDAKTGRYKVTVPADKISFANRNWFLTGRG